MRKTYIMALKVKQTPSRVRESAEIDLPFKIGTISVKIFSPNLRQSSAIVRSAVCNGVSGYSNHVFRCVAPPVVQIRRQI